MSVIVEAEHQADGEGHRDQDQHGERGWRDEGVGDALAAELAGGAGEEAAVAGGGDGGGEGGDRDGGGRAAPRPGGQRERGAAEREGRRVGQGGQRGAEGEEREQEENRQ